MKYCKNCGKELKDDAKFCPKCGSVVPVQEKSENYEKNEAKNISPVSDTGKPPHYLVGGLNKCIIELEL